MRGTLKPYTISDGGSSSGGTSHNDSSSGNDSASDNSLENTDSPNDNQNNGSSTNIGSSAQPEPSLPTTGEAKPVTLDTRGRVTVDHNTVLSAIEEARNAAKKNGTIENGIAVTIPVTPPKRAGLFSGITQGPDPGCPCTRECETTGDQSGRRKCTVYGY